MYVWAWAGGLGVTEVFFPLTAGERGSRGRAGWQRGRSPGRRGLRAWVRTASDPHQSLSSAGDSAPHFRDEETEAQRGYKTEPKSQTEGCRTGLWSRVFWFPGPLVEGREGEGVETQHPRSHMLVLWSQQSYGTEHRRPKSMTGGSVTHRERTGVQASTLQPG